ncbi:hypothetical protein HMPREF1494_1534 [Bifidobacterium sp. MSTE12]|nr:hypothetical protein HMPREF1494_1534 [Bifidobacterium sp. MSTE12]
MANVDKSNVFGRVVDCRWMAIINPQQSTTRPNHEGASRKD